MYVDGTEALRQQDVLSLKWLQSSAQFLIPGSCSTGSGWGRDEYSVLRAVLASLVKSLARIRHIQILFLQTPLITISLAYLQFSVYCWCSNTLFSLSCTHSLLTKAETLFPQATFCFACSNQIFRSVWDHMDPCKSTADMVNNMETSSNFMFSCIILAISNQSSRTMTFVALEKLNKTCTCHWELFTTNPELAAFFGWTVVRRLQVFYQEGLYWL